MNHSVTTASHHHRRPNRRRQSGFNFAEVLFAVMILGIGFIMVAAIFPVALQQTKITGEEVVASTVARGGVNYFQQIGLTPGALPVTDLATSPPAVSAIAYGAIAGNSTVRYPGNVLSFRDNRLEPDVRDAVWRQIVGNLILPDDPRVAWIGMYRRGVTYTNTNSTPALPGEAGVLASPDAFAHLILIGVNIRNRSIYEAGKDLQRYPVDFGSPPASVSLNPATLEPLTVYVKLTEREGFADQISFYADPTTPNALPVDVDAAVEGAYIVISDDQLLNDTSTTRTETRGERNGRVYRLSTRTAIGTWELAPDGDLTFINPDGVVGNGDDINENIPARPVGSAVAGGVPAWAFLVGRGYTDPTVPGTYEGTAQDTGVYVTFVPAN